jgi:hypothetical protein
VTGVKVPDVVGLPMKMLPKEASDFLRISTVWTPWDRVPVLMLVPVRLSMVFTTPSTETMMALVPVIEVIGTLAEVPVKVKVSPEAGHVNSLVAGFTRPRYRK